MNYLKIACVLTSVSLVVMACKKTEQKTFIVSCGKGSVETMLSQGWKVVSSNERQVKCGSRLSWGGPGMPPISNDVVGTEVEYILEK